jgi:hypothetical protein
MEPSLTVGYCPASRNLSRGNAEGTFDNFHKRPLFAQDEPLSLGHGEVGKRFRIGLQKSSVSLVSSETVEGNQSPRDIVRAFVGQKISHQMSAAARDDAAPVLGVLLEALTLEGIDLITDEACDSHLVLLFGSVEMGVL